MTVTSMKEESFKFLLRRKVHLNEKWWYIAEEMNHRATTRIRFCNLSGLINESTTSKCASLMAGATMNEVPVRVVFYYLFGRR